MTFDQFVAVALSVLIVAIVRLIEYVPPRCEDHERAPALGGPQSAAEHQSAR